MYKFYAFLHRMRYINRWSLMRSYFNENVAEHSHCVALLAHSLCVIENKLYGGKLNADRAAVIALYHETSEVLTGDLPTPIKYFNNSITDAYKALEAEAEQKIIRQLPPELKDELSGYITDKTSDEYKVVKYADKLAAYIKCIEEISAGNPEFNSAIEAQEAALKAADMKCVQYFIDNFIKAFYLTLDKLQSEDKS
ncbi:MAG: 5'-deoxynucleotidase [Clostridiales bacterium]|nr:5'-deoxynucleotidase [Clostridiales bacterium]